MLHRTLPAALAAAALVPSVAQAQTPPPAQAQTQGGPTAAAPAAPAAADVWRPYPCLPIGAAVDQLPFGLDPDYRAVLRDWDVLSSFTIETWHKFNFVRPHPGTQSYDFSVADQTIQDMVALGYGRGGMAFHTLFWHNRFQLDPWVEALGYQGTRRVMVEHIDAISQHYYGGPGTFPIFRVDLLNETLGDDLRLRPPGPQLTDNPWAQAGTAQAGYVDWAVFAVEQAEARFPAGTPLFYNDYNIEFGAIDSDPTRTFDPTGATHLSKADAAFKLVRDHLAPAGLDGVGIQAHLLVPYTQSVANLRNVVRRYAEIGIEVHITELDVGIDTGGNAPTPAQLQRQADLYREVLEIVVDEPNCTHVTIWGVTDPHSWIPTYAPHCPGCRAPLPHDGQGLPKPAAHAIEQVLGASMGPCPR